MKLYKITLILATISFISCNDNKGAKKQLAPQIVVLETPEVFQEEEDDSYDLSSSYSKRGYSDVIEDLFKEALEKDANLKNLVERMSDTHSLEYDSLDSYNDYIQNNVEYWSSVERNIVQIQDTILQKELREEYGAMKENQEIKMKKYYACIELIRLRKLNLQDQKIALKLVVTKSMMKN